MRVIFFGTSAFAVPSLEQVVQRGHAVVACVTQPDRPQGRGLVVEPSPVKRAAERLGLPLLQPERLDAAAFQPLQPDAGIVIAYGKLIPPWLLALPRHGMLGVHPSLLPKYRGAAPVAWALLNGERTTGVTIFRLNARLDAGELFAQRTVEIAQDEDAERLTERLARLGAEVLAQVLDDVAAGRGQATPQDDAQATVAPKLTKAQGWMMWDQPAAVLERVVRATVPWPGAATEWRGQPLKIWKAVAQDGISGAAPGTVIRAAADGVDIAAGAGVLRLLEMQPAGRRRMPVKEFLAGYSLQAGDRLGTTEGGG